MPSIQWKNDYSIKIDKIDEQHKHLINIINNFENAIEENEEKIIISNTLNSLVDYTIQHFKDEEKLMEECNYPALEEHKVLHTKLVKDVGDSLINFAQNENFDSNELLLFLKEWLIDHILFEDMKIGQFINQKENIGISS